MKLKEAVSWLMATLQRNLIPGLEACGERPLTDKEQQLANDHPGYHGQDG
jgi:hypothetical protein